MYYATRSGLGFLLTDIYNQMDRFGNKQSEPSPDAEVSTPSSDPGLPPEAPRPAPGPTATPPGSIPATAAAGLSGGAFVLGAAALGLYLYFRRKR